MFTNMLKSLFHGLGLFTKNDVRDLVAKATNAVILAAKIAGVDIEMIITQTKARVEEAKVSLAQHEALVEYLREQLQVAEKNKALAAAVLTNTEELLAALPENGAGFDLVPVTAINLHVSIPQEETSNE